MSEYVLLTGGTGLIGRYLIRDLVAAKVPVAVLARAGKGVSAEDRVRRLLGDDAPLDDSRLVCIEGDLDRPGLTVREEDRAWLAANCGSVLHNAACVNFHADADGEPWRTNVGGTERLVTFCREFGIGRFHYVSTAYVCGDRRGVIREADLEAGQSHGTAYESSKFQAERLLRAAGFDSLTVLRPGAVTGDSRTGYTSTYHGFYHYVQFTYLAALRAGAGEGERWHHPVRLFQTGEEGHHLIPVDLTSKAIAAVVADPAFHGRTYHVTPPKPVTAAQLEAALAEYFRYDGVTFAGPVEAPPADLSEIERLFYGALAGVEHRYIHGDPAFDCSNTCEAVPGWAGLELDHAYLVRAIDFAVRHRFGRRKAREERHAPAVAARV